MLVSQRVPLGPGVDQLLAQQRQQGDLGGGQRGLRPGRAGCVARRQGSPPAPSPAPSGRCPARPAPGPAWCACWPAGSGRRTPSLRQPPAAPPQCGPARYRLPPEHRQPPFWRPRGVVSPGFGARPPAPSGRRPRRRGPGRAAGRGCPRPALPGRRPARRGAPPAPPRPHRLSSGPHRPGLRPPWPGLRPPWPCPRPPWPCPRPPWPCPRPPWPCPRPPAPPPDPPLPTTASRVLVLQALSGSTALKSAIAHSVGDNVFLPPPPEESGQPGSVNHAEAAVRHWLHRFSPASHSALFSQSSRLSAYSMAGAGGQSSRSPVALAPGSWGGSSAPGRPDRPRAPGSRLRIR